MSVEKRYRTIDSLLVTAVALAAHERKGHPANHNDFDPRHAAHLGKACAITRAIIPRMNHARSFRKLAHVGMLTDAAVRPIGVPALRQAAVTTAATFGVFGIRVPLDMK
jgi:hypothetical protein